MSIFRIVEGAAPESIGGGGGGGSSGSESSLESPVEEDAQLSAYSCLLGLLK